MKNNRDIDWDQVLKKLGEIGHQDIQKEDVTISNKFQDLNELDEDIWYFEDLVKDEDDTIIYSNPNNKKK